MLDRWIHDCSLSVLGVGSLLGDGQYQDLDICMIHEWIIFLPDDTNYPDDAQIKIWVVVRGTTA